MYTAVIRILDGDIVKYIIKEEPYDAEFDDTSVYVQKLVPEGTSMYCLKARRLSEGVYEFYTDTDLMNSYQQEKLFDVRQQRNQLLSSCDWVMLSDVTMTEAKRQEWLDYRQALRDLPLNLDLSSSSNISVVWPSRPL